MSFHQNPFSIYIEVLFGLSNALRSIQDVKNYSPCSFSKTGQKIEKTRKLEIEWKLSQKGMYTHQQWYR